MTARTLGAMRRPLAACFLLLAVYAGLSFANDPKGTLGTDTGGKVATLRSMEQHGGAFDPDVGYWAAKWDPQGNLHPLYYTVPIGRKWVNVTTVPVLYAAYPLYRLGGYRLTLVLPMLGSLAAALAAMALSRRLGGRGWLAFWVTGLLSPLVIYALDFWEHSIGVGLMAWAVVLLVDLHQHSGQQNGKDLMSSAGQNAGLGVWGRAVGAGLLFGAAATMRTEALVYGAVATGAVCLVMFVRGGRGRSVLVGLAVLIALLVPLGANALLEQATVGGAIRSARASSTAESAGGSTITRIEEGVVTALGLQPDVSWASALVGGAAVALIAGAAARLRRGGDPGPAVLAGAGSAALYAVRLSRGLGFVPGMLPASPVASAAALDGRQGETRVLLLTVAVVALPIVWAFQFLGGAYAQWGGRYVLLSGLLLTAVGATTAESLPRPAVLGMLALAAFVTGFGLVWMSSRTHDVARAEAKLSRRTEQVVISRIGHLAREGGAFYRFGGREWLTAVPTKSELAAVDVVRRSGARTMAVIDDGKGPAGVFAGTRRTGTDHVEFLGLHLRVTSYAVAARS